MLQKKSSSRNADITRYTNNMASKRIAGKFEEKYQGKYIVRLLPTLGLVASYIDLKHKLERYVGLGRVELY